ncbi:hypothetical protein ZWY2020_004336 [Hordeum vulgare]|nr:hypothetical protein ZWY2020_004336 [Hordeum vulgare]
MRAERRRELRPGRTPAKSQLASAHSQLASFPTLSSACVMDELEEGAGLKWVRTTVELDDHIIVPNLDPVAMSIEPDRTLEDYLASLSTLPMDHSRPLWEFHVLDFPTSDATAALAFRAHHSLGDGASLLSLLIAAADPSKVLPTTAPRRVSTMKALTPRSPSSAGAGVMVVFTVWIVSLLLLVWHTVVDIVCFAATAISMLRDPPTLFKGPGGAEFRPKRFVNRMLSLDDIKYVKSVMCCTVNDVLLGVTSAALSRYYFRKTGESGKKNIKVRSTFIVNLRKMTGQHALTIHYQSYMNIVKLILAIDEAQFPDVDGLLEDFVESLRLIREAALGKPRIVEECSQEEHGHGEA